MDIEKISKIIKEKRKEKGLTQEELAIRINVTEKAVSRWETGRGTPDISLLVPLSNELGISVSELLKGKVDKIEEDNIKDIISYIDKSKNNKSKYVITVASIIYTVLLVIYLWYLKIEYSTPSGFIRYQNELFYNFIFIATIFLTNRFISNNYYDSVKDRINMNRVSYIMILIIYLIMFFNLTIFGRDISILNSYNLVPFKTIIGYWMYPDLHNIIVNILGNIVILMPIQFLIMKIFDIKKYSIGLLISIILSLSIELIQLITHTGIFDIDDILLNVLGMSIMYYIAIKRYKYLAKYKDMIITSFISLIIVFKSFDMLSWYHFGHVPNFRIVLRLILGFSIIEFIIYFIFKKVIKRQ